jgi:hypothetical protein
LAGLLAAFISAGAAIRQVHHNGVLRLTSRGSTATCRPRSRRVPRCYSETRARHAPRRPVQYEIRRRLLSDEYDPAIMIWSDEQRALGGELQSQAGRHRLRDLQHLLCEFVETLDAFASVRRRVRLRVSQLLWQASSARAGGQWLGASQRTTRRRVASRGVAHRKR